MKNLFLITIFILLNQLSFSQSLQKVQNQLQYVDKQGFIYRYDGYEAYDESWCLDTKVFYELKSIATKKETDINNIKLIYLNNKYYYYGYTDLINYYLDPFLSRIRGHSDFIPIKHKAKEDKKNLWFIAIEISEYIAMTKFKIDGTNLHSINEFSNKDFTDYKYQLLLKKKD